MKTLRLAAGLSLAMAIFAVSGLALGQQPASERVAFAIEEQPLGSALTAFARQAQVQILRRDEEVSTRGKIAPAVNGELLPHEALDRLLANTGLRYEFINERTVRIAMPDTDGHPVSGVAGGKTEEAVQLAQRDAGADQAETSASASAQDTSAAAAGSEGTLQEIVVTAQKRVERLQDVPISISVMRGEDLDRSTAEGITEALNRVPGVTTSAALQGGGTQVAVRGVTASGALFSGSSPVAYYLDSVPFGLIKTAIAPDSNAYDLERVEVLRGPQGTLYGASAQNGVVRVLTHDADLDQFEFKARTSASNTESGSGNYRGDAALNLPLVAGKLAARAVVGYQDLSGWIDRPTQDNANDAQIRNMRLKLNAQPTDLLSVGLSVWASRGDYGAPPQGDINDRTTAVLDESAETDYDAYGLRIGYDLSAFSVTSMTSHLNYENNGDLDLLPFVGVALPLFTGLDSKVFSQELVLNSTHQGVWRWSFGGIYRDGEDRLLQEADFFPVPIDFSDTSESFAVFGELTRVFMDGRFELTGGLRYFEDKVTQIENVPQPPALPTDPLLPPDRRKFTATSPRVVLSWHPDGNSTLYGSYSEGFRSGFNQNANVIRNAPEFAPLEADTLANYELGAKGSLWGGRVQYDAAVYYIDWQDVQQTIAVTVGLPVTVAINGASASGTGFEFAAVTQPLDGLELSVSFGWNDLKMDSIVRSFPEEAPPEGVALFEKGDRLNLSAEYTAGVSADYAFPLGAAGLTGRFSASANYSSEQIIRDIVGGAPVQGVGDSILTAQTSFSVEAAKRWTASIFADNVTDEEGSPIRQVIGAPFWSQRLRPRTVGIQLEYRFGGK